jgi:hypothetical protein
MAAQLADRGIYLEGQRFTIEICKQLIAEPALWLIYDDHPLHGTLDFELDSQVEKAKLAAFAHLHLNMFEIVFAEAPNPNERERTTSDVWIDYFHDTLTRCSSVRQVLADPSADRIWSPVMLAEYRKWKKLGNSQ